jgi:HK97 family phage major capsid protein/HK97 family phage prohead protease
MQHRAYSLLTLKSADDDRRILRGVATTPEPDRVGDVVEPKGVKFKNPLPLLLFHDSRLPVGTATFSKATDDGIEFEATLADPGGSDALKARIDEAWASVKAGLIKGVSIGFRALDDGIELLRSGGYRFTKTEVMELSLVVIPANASAVIQTIKSIDAQHLGVSAEDGSSTRAGAAARPPVRLLPSRREQTMKTLQEQIDGYQSTRDQKFKQQQALMTKAGEAGQTLDGTDGEQYDALDSDIEDLDKHIARLEKQMEREKTLAVPPPPTPIAAHVSRRPTHVQVMPNEEKGMGFTRAVLCKALAAFHGGSPIDYAMRRYPDNDRVQAYLKANIPAGTTTDVTWASPLVDPTNLASEFIDFLRPQTIIGKFGQGNVPSLARVPFNVRITGQTSGGDAYWVGQGAPKPITKFDFNAITLGIAKVAAISVITEELARLSTPSAEARVRDSLAKAVIARIDTDFIDPTQAAVANVSPASITNGVTPLSPSGVTADAARSDIARIIKAYLDNNMDPSSLVLIMPTALALSLSVQVNSLGQAEFASLSMQGGSLLGLPVITSQYAANQSGAGNLVIAVNASEVFLADDGQVTVDASREASLQMLDNPTNSSATATATTMVSMFQTNSIALRAERFINWAKARTTAVVFMDDVNWGSIGSPA